MSAKPKALGPSTIEVAPAEPDRKPHSLSATWRNKHAAEAMPDKACGCATLAELFQHSVELYGSNR